MNPRRRRPPQTISHFGCGSAVALGGFAWSTAVCFTIPSCHASCGDSPKGDIAIQLHIPRSQSICIPYLQCMLLYSSSTSLCRRSSSAQASWGLREGLAKHIPLNCNKMPSINMRGGWDSEKEGTAVSSVKLESAFRLTLQRKIFLSHEQQKGGCSN